MRLVLLSVVLWWSSPIWGSKAQIRSDQGYGCVQWCRVPYCHITKSELIYCCSFDILGRRENFIENPCQQPKDSEKTAKPKTTTTMKPQTATVKPTIQAFKCPAESQGSPMTRNCREMRSQKQCLSNADCDGGRICCLDSCFRKPTKICHTTPARKCPVDKLAKYRNCAIEMTNKIECKSENDCPTGESCCQDNCLQPGLKICKLYKEDLMDYI